MLLSVLSVCLSACLSVTLVYRGQTVEWIKMSHGREVGIGQATLCQMGTQPLPLKRGGAQQPPPTFRPVSIMLKQLDP